MMAVVLPAASASRTSIQVISSIHTVLGAGRGFLASMQLYAFRLHWPPPRLRALAARAESDCWAACGFCAMTDDAVRVIAARTRRAFIVISDDGVGDLKGCDRSRGRARARKEQP